MSKELIERIRKTCGRTTGHGESCSPGWECSACAEKARAADAIELLQRELGEARKALAYAISEADGWFDECRGGEAIKTPEMDAARRIAAKQS